MKRIMRLLVIVFTDARSDVSVAKDSASHLRRWWSYVEVSIE